MKHVLEQLGLTTSEIKIYTMLLNEGTSSAGDISQKTGIHRRNVYDCLERLIQKGLVGYMKENSVKVYSITDPSKIVEKVNTLQKEVDEILPDLQQKFNAIHGKKETLFFRGKEGLRMVLKDQIKEGNEVLVNATAVRVSSILHYFFPKYHLLRKENKIATRMIFDESYRSLNAEELRKLPLCSVRYIRNFNKSPMAQYIYGNTVAIVVWGSDPIAIVIRQKEVAQGFRDAFEVLWRMSK